MSLLLDTHVWLWSLENPERLPSAVRDTLTSSGRELWLSPISVWEALRLAERGRIDLGMDVDTWLDRATTGSNLREAPLTHEIARTSRRLRLETEDPADRFLAATAVVLDFTLVTADRRLIRSRQVPTLAAA